MGKMIGFRMLRPRPVTLMLLGLLLIGCEKGSGIPACGYNWEGAPCSDEGSSWYACDPDAQVFECRSSVWKPTTWPCWCIDEDGSLLDIPGCQQAL